MSVLVVAAHPDDEVLGCGGTIARHVAEGDTVRVLYVADGETSRIQHGQKHRNPAADAACKVLGVAEHAFLDLRDQRLDTWYTLLEITQAIEAYAAKWKPRIVYTHHLHDLNLDHVRTYQAVKTAFRPLPGSFCKAIHCFEVLSSTEWGSKSFHPNHWVDISPFALKKLDALACYEDEMRSPPHTRSYESVGALEKYRGHSVGVDRAEAFYTAMSIR